MRVGTSPGMSRMRANTITLTRKSVGMASASRRRTYCFMRSAGGVRPGPSSPIEPGVGQPHAETVTVVVLEALHGRRMSEVLRPLRDVDVVGLVGQIALDVVHDLLAFLGIHLPPLRHQHLAELGVGHPALVGG